LRYSASQTFSTAGILTGASTRQEIIALPRTFQPLGGNLAVELSPSLASAILSSLQARSLPDKDWSNEQIVSDFLPNLVTYQTLRDSGLPNPALAGALKTSVPESVYRLLASQDSTNGGWGWTIGSSQNDLYLTAYILFGLQQFAASDLTVDADLAGADPHAVEQDHGLVEIHRPALVHEGQGRDAALLEAGQAFRVAVGGHMDLLLPGGGGQLLQVELAGARINAGRFEAQVDYTGIFVLVGK